MKMSEYTKNEWKKMKDKPPKERLAYFWEYYKWPAIIAVLVVAAIIYTVSAQMGKKEAVLSGILLNSSVPLEDPAFLQDFCHAAGIDTEIQEIVLNTGLSLTADDPTVGIMTYQRIHAGIAAKETDFVIATAEAFRQCSYDSSRMFMDLRQVLSAEKLAELEGRLYYIDGSLFEKIYSEGETVAYPSPFNHEEMTDPVPVGIDIRECTDFLDSYYHTEEPVYFAVVTNAPHLDRALQFFEFMTEYRNEE